jgi:tetratricopeptide (TPR) repeat protein
MSSHLELTEQKSKEAHDTKQDASLVAAVPSHAIAAVNSFSGSPTSPAALTLLLSRLHQYDLLNAVYRSYLSTHLESGQVWYLLSLSLLSASRLEESFLAIRECLTRCANDVPALMLAAQISLKLSRGKESVEYSSRAMRGCKANSAALAAQQALEVELAAASAAGTSPRTLGMIASGLTEEAEQVKKDVGTSFKSLAHHSQIQASLLQTCQLLFGVACSRYAYSVSTFSNRKSLQKRALHALESAYKQQQISSSSSSSSPSSSSSRLLFALACLSSDIREIPRALSLARRVLQMERTDAQHWNLVALLLTAQKKYRSALLACEQGLTLCPSPLPLLLTRARIQSHLGLQEEAVATCAEMARQAIGGEGVHMRECKIGGNLSNRPSFKQVKEGEARRTGEFTQAEAENQAQQVETLLVIAAVYSRLASPSAGGKDEWLLDAFDALSLARSLASPLLQPDVHCAFAKVAEKGGATAQAARHYESALVLDAHHTSSLLGLARLERAKKGGNLVLAYGYLMSALQVDATNHEAWYEMGLILQAQGKSSAAAEHFVTSLELEKTAPIASFQTIPRHAAERHQ